MSVEVEGGTTGRLDPRIAAVARLTAVVLAAFGIFGLLLLAKGADPLAAYGSMFSSTFLNPRSVQQIVIQMTPLLFAALAVAVPARAGLTNVGGEGQLIIGGVGACATYLWLGETLPGIVALLAMLIGAAIAGGIWAGIAAALRIVVGVNEAITTLLLNFVALDVLLFLIYQPWRVSPSAQPASREVIDADRLPVFMPTQINVGIVLALIAVVAVAIALNHTRWGFAVSVAGGNAEAARRAGMRVWVLILGALVVGGMLAGIAGFIQFAGVENKLRPGFGVTLGYTAFLASWLVRHHPIAIVGAAFVFASLSVASDSLQIDTGLPDASINVLKALILIAVLGWLRPRKEAP